MGTKWTKTLVAAPLAAKIAVFAVVATAATGAGVVTAQDTPQAQEPTAPAAETVADDALAPAPQGDDFREDAAAIVLADRRADEPQEQASDEPVESTAETLEARRDAITEEAQTDPQIQEVVPAEDELAEEPAQQAEVPEAEPEELDDESEDDEAEESEAEESEESEEADEVDDE